MTDNSGRAEDAHPGRGPDSRNGDDPDVPLAELDTSALLSSAPDGAGPVDPVMAEEVSWADTRFTAGLPRVPEEPPWPPGFQNLAARGGAIGALLLGLLALAGAWLTPWAAVNAVLGLMLGAWGLYSPMRRTSLIGMALSVASLAVAALV